MTVLIAKDLVREPLYVVVPCQNVWRHKTRWKHTERAVKHFIDSGAVVYLVEIAFNRREFVFADSGIDGLAANCGILGQDSRFRHRYIPLRSSSELWLKECAVNVGAQHLPYDWQQVAWIDSDVHFVRPNWVGTSIHLLQNFDFLQMFSQARDLAPNYEMLPEDYPHASGVGFIHNYMKQTFEVSGVVSQNTIGNQVAFDIQVAGNAPYPSEPRVWPGLAWCCTRNAFEGVGGLIDFAIWGGGDFAMSWALVGRPDKMMNPNLHANYKAMTQEWADRAERHVRRNVGCMTGAVFHGFHGRKTGRGYSIKHRLLAKVGFDPIKHLKRDYQGLWQLHDDGSETYVKLRDLLRHIAFERDEDSNDTRLDLFEQGH